MLEPGTRLLFLRQNFDGLKAEADSAKGQEPEPLRQTEGFQEARSSQPAGVFGPDPIEFLAAFERLSDGPFKRYVWSQNKLFFEVCLKERDWRKIVAASARVEASHELAADSFSVQLDQIKDPNARSTFLRQHESEIHEELRQAKDRARMVRDTQPATL